MEALGPHSIARAFRPQAFRYDVTGAGAEPQALSGGRPRKCHCGVICGHPWGRVRSGPPSTSCHL